MQAIERTTAILRLLGEESSGLSLGQIASRVGLPRSTVQRIVGALAAEGFVSTGRQRGSIRLGPEIQKLAQAANTKPGEHIRPVMQAIARKTGETVDLAVLQDGQMLFIDQIVGSQRLRTVSSIGETFPLTTTANGKAALACLKPDEAMQLIVTETDAKDGNDLSVQTILNDIENIRTGALARDEGEHTDGISALGFGIRAANGDVFSISVPVPSSRFARLQSSLIEALTTARKVLTD